METHFQINLSVGVWLTPSTPSDRRLLSHGRYSILCVRSQWIVHLTRYQSIARTVSRSCWPPRILIPKLPTVAVKPKTRTRLAFSGLNRDFCHTWTDLWRYLSCCRSTWQVHTITANWSMITIRRTSRPETIKWLSQNDVKRKNRIIVNVVTGSD